MEEPPAPRSGLAGRAKFIVGGLLIVAAVIYLIASSTKASAQYFLTIEELNNKKSQMLDRDIRLSGAVLGDSINYDPQTLTLKFVVANIPGDNKDIEAQGGLAQVLHDAVIDPNRPRMEVIYVGPKPDLLRDEAQAIMTGKLGQDGIFYAEELLLKCPTKYEEAVPQQAEG
jgi:cytochrome c-type biogenesis protein CcmE